MAEGATFPRHRYAALAVVAALLAAPTAGLATCRQALALGLDVSGSVDAVEYRLQLDGLAQALQVPAVREVLLAMPDVPIQIAVFEWSASSYQRLLVDWTALVDAGSIAAVTERLQRTARAPAPETTGLGGALVYGAALLARAPGCAQLTLDISGDGENNDWPRPRQVVAGGQMGEITVNALVIGQDQPDGGRIGNDTAAELSNYFRGHVITGPGAFVGVALGYDDYANAMTRKLLRETASIAIGSYSAPPKQEPRQLPENEHRSLFVLADANDPAAR